MLTSVDKVGGLVKKVHKHADVILENGPYKYLVHFT